MPITDPCIKPHARVSLACLCMTDRNMFKTNANCGRFYLFILASPPQRRLKTTSDAASRLKTTSDAAKKISDALASDFSAAMACVASGKVVVAGKCVELQTAGMPTTSVLSRTNGTCSFPHRSFPPPSCPYASIFIYVLMTWGFARTCLGV